MFAIVHQNIKPEQLKAELGHDACGGFVSFEGWVRNHNEGKAVKGLIYEAYEALAVKEGNRVLNEALTKFNIRLASCQHRVGELPIGGIAVWVGVSSDHRDAAFQACRYIIDEIKTRLPIWKKELYLNGDTEWVDCRECAKNGHARDHNNTQLETNSPESSHQHHPS